MNEEKKTSDVLRVCTAPRWALYHLSDSRIYLKCRAYNKFRKLILRSERGMEGGGELNGL